MSSEIIKLLESRGVTVNDIADIVFALQKPYHPDLERDPCVDSVVRVLGTREVQHALYTGITLDVLAEQNALPEPLQSIMRSDEPLYGIDEILALSITNVYGTIGLTSFGYLDKEKMGIIAKLNDKRNGIHVFLDDLIAGVAAAASARIAHRASNP